MVTTSDLFLTLTDKEKDIIQKRFLPRIGARLTTLRELAAIYGVSKERIRQVEWTALRKIQRLVAERCNINRKEGADLRLLYGMMLAGGRRRPCLHPECYTKWLPSFSADEMHAAAERESRTPEARERMEALLGWGIQGPGRRLADTPRKPKETQR